MVAKFESIQMALPIEECYKIMEETGSRLGYKIKSSAPNYIKWKVGGAWDFKSGVNYDLETSLVSAGSDKTEIMVKSSAFGLHDGFGILSGGVKTYITAFKKNAMNKLALKKEFICPKCKKPVQQGAPFCPKDGTAVAQFCARCGLINELSNNFCANCGNKL